MKEGNDNNFTKIEAQDEQYSQASESGNSLESKEVVYEIQGESEQESFIDELEKFDKIHWTT